MTTFTGSDISLGAGPRVRIPTTTELHYDFTYRDDGSIVANLYPKSSDGSGIDVVQFAYTSAEVNAITVSETTITGKFNEAGHKLEKARLESGNPSATFTITL